MSSPRLQLLAIASGALAIALIAGCSNTTNSSTHTDTMMPPSSTTGAGAADAMFAQMMIPHHEQAVTMADLASTRASSPVIVDLAEQIRSAQQPEIDEMSSWLADWGLPVMTSTEAMSTHGGHGMSGMLTQEQLDELEAASGPTFDRLFAEFMIEHHEGAIDMARAVTVSDDPRVVKLANDIIEAQRAEIVVMQRFLNEN